MDAVLTGQKGRRTWAEGHAVALGEHRTRVNVTTGPAKRPRLPSDQHQEQ